LYNSPDVITVIKSDGRGMQQEREMRNTYKILILKLDGMTLRKRLISIRDDNIKTNLKSTECGIGAAFVRFKTGNRGEFL
jgi:hypothetical protein